MSVVLKKINSSSAWIEQPFKTDCSILQADKGEVYFAQLLQDLGQFSLDLDKIRQKLNLAKPLCYPDDNNIVELVDLKGQLADAQRKILNDEVKKLAKELGLPQTWLLPLEVLVITNVLPIPSKTSPFTFYQPGISPPLPSVDQMDCPKLIFQAEFTIKQLEDWINQNRVLLHKIGGSLPEDPGKKYDGRAFALQRIIFTLKEYENKTSSEVYDLLQIIYNKSGLDTSEIISLTPKDIDDYYNRHKRYLKSVYQ